MTDLRNPAAETHVHLPNWAAATELHPAVGERTVNLIPFVETPPTLRRPHATGEIPLYEPQTIAVVDAAVITGEIVAEETATEALFAAAMEVADEPLVEDVPDEDLVPGYAAGSDERPPPTLPTPPHPKPGAQDEHQCTRVERRREARQVVRDRWLTALIALGVSLLANAALLLWVASQVADR